MSRDKTLLHPELFQIVQQFETKCKAAGLNVLVTETYRSKSEQDALYAQGRTKPGNIVTNAKYPSSPHCWGVAFDFCRNVRGREYDDSDGFFRKCGEIGKSLGLAWGGDFRSFVDKPHLEMAEFLPNNSVKTLQAKYGTPEKFIENWVKVSTQRVKISTQTVKEDDEMTYEKWKEYFEKYMEELAEEPVPDWAKAELQAAVDLGITDGTRPMQLIPRYQAAIMAKRAALHMITL